MDYFDYIIDLDYYLIGKGKLLGSPITYLLYIVSIIGFFFIIQFLMGAFSFINRQCLRKQKNFKQEYGGKDSWAVITGGSDGIGLEYSKEMGR